MSGILIVGKLFQLEEQISVFGIDIVYLDIFSLVELAESFQLEFETGDFCIVGGF
jgi:hypothetical protein